MARTGSAAAAAEAVVTMPTDKGPQNEESAFRAAGPYLTLGLQMAATIVVFFFIGRFLDERLSMSPWCMIGALFIGCTGGLVQFIRTVNRLTQEEDERAGKKN
jgi:F0F1-type ATP synthase assembly protein I